MDAGLRNAENPAGQSLIGTVTTLRTPAVSPPSSGWNALSKGIFVVKELGAATVTALISNAGTDRESRNAGCPLATDGARDFASAYGFPSIRPSSRLITVAHEDMDVYAMLDALHRVLL